MKNNNSGDYVKKSTMLIVAFITLFIGFISGSFYSSYKSAQINGSVNQSGPPGQQQQFSENLNEKILRMKQMAASNPKSSEAWIQLGNAYFDSNHYKNSIEAYQNALELKPKNADVWTDMGVMYRRSDQPEKAIECFNEAIKVNPRHENSLFNKGIVLLYDLNDKERAFKVWDKLLEINPFARASNGRTIAEIYELVKKDQAEGN